MYTDGFIQLVDKHLRETPISTTPFPNYINSCSTNTPTDKSIAIRKIGNTVDLPGFVAYPYLDDPFDDIDNQDKYLLHNYNNSPNAGFSFIFNEVNNYYSQFCKYIPFVDGSIYMDVQLLVSYNQQLFVSIFNIINSYNNQKDTIWNNISYLKYFYHLFPIHVGKFYSLFDRFFNPKIEELKKSIISLKGLMASINCQIVDLNNTHQTIEKLSTEITSNVTELNDSISQQGRFKFLVEAMKRQLCSDISRIEQLDRNTQIEQELCKKLQEIQKQVEAKRCEIFGKLKAHEDEFKMKIIGHNDEIMPELYSFYNPPESKARKLKTKIKHLLSGSRSLDKLHEWINRYGDRLGNYLNYMSVLQNPSVPMPKEYNDQILELMDSIRVMYRKRWVYRNAIPALLSQLSHIGDILDDEGPIQQILWNLGSRSPENVNEYRIMLESDIASLEQVKYLASRLSLNSKYRQDVDEAILTGITIKTLVNQHTNTLRGGLVSLVRTLEQPESNVLEGIERDLSSMRPDIRKIIIYLSNTGTLLNYLEAVSYYKERLERFEINEPEINNIGRFSGQVRSFLGLAKEAGPRIRSKAKETRKTLERISRNKVEHSEYIKTYSPGSISFGPDPGSELRGFLEIASSVEQLRDRAKEVDISSKVREAKESIHRMTDIGAALGVLESINGILARHQSSIVSSSGGIQESYRSIQHVITYFGESAGTNGIQKHVESIGTIPGEILKLRFFVEWSIGLFKTVKSIIDTLKEVEGEAEKMRGIETTLEKTKHQVESVEKRYKHMGTNIWALSWPHWELNNLNKLKGNMEDLRYNLGIMKKNIKMLKMNKEYLTNSKTKIRHYVRILSHIQETLKYKPYIGIPPFMISPTYPSIRLHMIKKYEKSLLPIKAHLENITEKTNGMVVVLNHVENEIGFIVGSNLVGSIEGKVNEVDSSIIEVESSLEEGIICFLKCSNESITNNTIKSAKALLTSGGQVYNNELAKSIPHARNIQGSENNDNVWALLSNMAIIESKFVASKLYESIERTDKILNKLSWIKNCQCIEYSKPGDCGLDFMRYIENKFEYDKYQEHRKCVVDNQGNHLCLCLVINYVLYPNIMKCMCCLVDIDFGAISVISRKFDQYGISSKHRLDISKMLVFFINSYAKITDLVYGKYFPGGFSYLSGPICFCKSPDEVNYKYFISSIIYISFLVENMFNHQNEKTGDSIQSLSALKAELNYNDSYPKRIFNKISPKDCKFDKKICGCKCECGTKKGNCCCLCVYCCIVCVCICLACKICKSLNGKCDNPFKEIKQLESVCKCDCAGDCCFKKLLEKLKGCENGCEGILNLEDCCSKECTGKPDCCCNELKNVCKTSCDALKKLCKSPCDQKLKNCKDEKCGCCKLFCRSVLVLLRFSNCVIKQIHTNVLVMCICCCFDEKGGEIKKWIEQSNLSYNTNMATGIRGIRILDSTNEISNNRFEGVSNNNYTYNDAYRINTSRAHGSLKYIIIKIVLILIIVVMTIFIRVKIETDDDYKMDNLLSEENGMCECSVENNENGVQNGNQINTTYNNHKNNGTRKNSRTKGMKKKSLMIVMSVISGLYLNVVIRDLYVVLSLEYNVWSYFVSVVVCLGLTCSLLSRYCVHLYDFVYVLEQYGLKMSKVESLVDDKFGGESGTSMISSQFVMLYGLLKSVVGDLTSALSMSVSQSSYNEMKDVLYPYKNMEGALHKMISGSDEYLSNLGKLRESVMESAIVGGCVDLYNVLDFLSYVLMSKTFFEFDEYQAYFHGNERYVAWRLGKSLNHNFFLVSYYRYSTIYSIDAQVQNLRLGEKHLATRNCMMLWRMFGEMEIELITLRSMCEESLDVPMTDIQKDLLKSRFKDEYLAEFQKFQLYVVSTLFNVREHKRVRTREIESSFPFADLFNEQMLDKNRLSKLSAKYFDTNYRRLLSSMSLPTRTCDVSGHVEEVQRRVSAFCSHWLDLRYEYCKSIRSLGCEKAVNFAHDLVMSTLKEPEQIDTKITQMLANINLENIDFIQQLLETDETLKEKYHLKEFHNTLDTLTHIHPISDNYETTVLHYLNQYVISSLLNKDKIMLPLGIYLSWYGAALTEQHISCIHKYQFFI